MQIDEIKNPILKKLVEGARHSVGTVEADLHDALDGSQTDDELIAMWQSALESLKDEICHYWSGLEELKCKLEWICDSCGYVGNGIQPEVCPDCNESTDNY